MNKVVYVLVGVGVNVLGLVTPDDVITPNNENINR